MSLGHLLLSWYPVPESITAANAPTQVPDTTQLVSPHRCQIPVATQVPGVDNGAGRPPPPPPLIRRKSRGEIQRLNLVFFFATLKPRVE